MDEADFGTYLIAQKAFELSMIENGWSRHIILDGAHKGEMHWMKNINGRLVTWRPKGKST